MRVQGAATSALTAVLRAGGRRRSSPHGHHGVLVVAMGEIGDFVLLTPFLRALRQMTPDSPMHLAVTPGVAGLAEACPWVDDVIEVPTALGVRRAPRSLLAALSAGRRLHSTPPEVAIVPRWDVDYHFATPLAWVSGAARVVGFTSTAPGRAELNRGYDRLLTDPVHSDGSRHEVERLWELLPALGDPPPGPGPTELFPSDADRDAGARVVRSVGADRVVAVAPGARQLGRRWPVESFSRVAEILAGDGCGVLVVGGPDDRDAGAAVVAAARRAGGAAASAAGELGLGATTAALAGCAALVANDSAPAHLASAVGTPVVVVSRHPQGAPAVHVNAPERFAPWGVPSVVLRPEPRGPACAAGCRSDDAAHCIAAVSADEVVAAARQLLGQAVARR